MGEIKGDETFLSKALRNKRDATKHGLGNTEEREGETTHTRIYFYIVEMPHGTW